MHLGAVVSDAPSPLSTPRSAAGQAQLRLGKPLRMKCRASPVLLFMRAGRVVAGSVGIVRATVPFHGEHDAQEPTKVKCGQGGGRASALAPELQQPPRATLPRDGRPIGADISRRPGWSATTLWQSSYLAADQAAQAAPIGTGLTDIAPPGRRPFARPVRAAAHQRPSRGLGSWRLPPRPPAYLG